MCDGSAQCSGTIVLFVDVLTGKTDWLCKPLISPKAPLSHTCYHCYVGSRAYLPSSLASQCLSCKRCGEPKPAICSSNVLLYVSPPTVLLVGGKSLRFRDPGSTYSKTFGLQIEAIKSCICWVCCIPIMASKQVDALLVYLAIALFLVPAGSRADLSGTPTTWHACR
jgi:hypothetical protein